MKLCSGFVYGAGTVGLMLIGFVLIGCGGDLAKKLGLSPPQEAPAQSTPRTSSDNLGIPLSVEPPTAADTKSWLESGLPPLEDADQPPPFELGRVQISVNQVEQQTLQAEYRRSRVVRTLAAEVKLVILPSRGGRYAVYADPGMTISPLQSGTIHAFVDNLLDYRGKIPGGARAYLEMLASSPIQRSPPVRLSFAVWIGTDDELAAALRQGAPVTLDPAKNDTSPATIPLPADVALSEGTPVRFLAGDRWIPATVWKSTPAAEPPSLLAFLARPGGLYKPWFVDADRRDVRIESAALDQLNQSPGSFAERFNSYRQRLATMDAPNHLEPASSRPFEIGQRVLTLGFGVGGLDPLEVIGPVQAGVVRVRRTVLDHREFEKPVAALYIDPQPPGN